MQRNIDTYRGENGRQKLVQIELLEMKIIELIKWKVNWTELAD
jgi:hypothetical protein